ncbi:dihydrofolate reductase family protein [Nocardioides sp. CER19]|uniref:dihydrofolate reductase family protein n=1 Tax=Nocardioides sp. CER19 TaxID=3038538 RepID=UPI00244716AE|nr:dihydrofolate reductase family protein [Nocardioides sp. CER19]MDH2416671.1 dihydrofolate reductase family protein [Nocardioides sp. CER19]
MTRFVYATATTLDGFLADADNSLDWLFAVEGGDESLASLDTFVAGVGVMVEGSTTYRWVLEHEHLLDSPEKWQQFYGDKKTFVFSTQADLPLVPGADITVVAGAVADHLDEIRAAAGEKDVWLVGGGDLVGQFDDAGALDQLTLSIAAVTLGSGAPLLPRRIESDRLRLVEVAQTGQFVSLRYDVLR